MATGHDSTIARQEERELARKSRSNFGRFHEGRWYCDCPGQKLAIYRKAGEATENAGKFFWRCSEDRDTECGFFLFADKEESRKARLARLQDPPLPKTPTSMERPRLNGASSTKSLDDPWSKSKRPRDDPQDGLLEDEGGSPSDRTLVADEMMFVDLTTPSHRKAARRTKFSSPHRTSTEIPGSPVQAMSATRFGKQPMSPAMASASRNHHQTSVIRELFQPDIGLDSKAEYKLTMTVVNLIQSAGIQLDETTMDDVRLEINLVLDHHQATVQRYKDTISHLRQEKNHWRTIAIQE